MLSRNAIIAMIAGGLVLTLVTGLRQAMGLFVKPISIDLQTGREIFALGIALQNLLWGMGSPFTGALADKYGAPRVIMAGGLLYALGHLSLSFSYSGGQVIFSTFVMGLGMAGAGFSTVLGAVGRLAGPENRSVALGVATAGGSFGQFLLTPIGHVLLEETGWRMAMVVLAGIGALAVPLAIGLKEEKNPNPVSWTELGQALKLASQHRGYQLLAAGFFVCGFSLVFLATHLPPFLSDKGMPSWLGAWSLSTIGLFNIFGSYYCGVLGNKYRKKYLLAGIYALRGLAFAVFALVPLSNGSVLVFAAFTGLLWLGTVPLTSGLIAQIFGTAHMSMLYGVVFLSHQVGSFAGAWLGGYLFDLTQSYGIMWWVNVALGITAAALHLPINDKPLK